MKRILIFLLLYSVTSYAGWMGGALVDTTNVSGTYTETTSSGSQEWNLEMPLDTAGLQVGYGYVDTLSVAAYACINDGSDKVGINLQYGHDMFGIDLYPHILVGIGGMSSNNIDISGNNNLRENDVYYFSEGYGQIGGGLSYVFGDKLELYTDLIVRFNSNSNQKTKFSYYDYKTDQTVEGYSGQQWDNVTFGINLGIRFHVFGAATLAGQAILDEQSREEQAIEDEINRKEEEKEAIKEQKRVKKIDTFIN